MENLQKYQQVFAEIFDVAPALLNEGFTFAGVESWDSMSHLSLITALEDAFDVMFETEDIIHFGSYRNGIEILRRYGICF